MSFSRKGYVVFAIAMLLAICSVSAWGQASTGTVQGLVTDQQGASMPGVDIKLIDPSTNITLTTKTNDAGRYIIPNVSPGTYNIMFSKAGFSTRKVNKQAAERVGDPQRQRDARSWPVDQRGRSHHVAGR